MSSAKHVLEKISAISAFVVGLLLCIIFVPSFAMYMGNSFYFVIEFLIVVAINASLISIGAIVGFEKTRPPMFGKMFSLAAVSGCAALLYSSPLVMFMYAIPCITGIVSLFLKREGKSSKAIDKTDPIILDLIAKNENKTYNKEVLVRRVSQPSKVFDIETEILKLKKLKDKELIDDEQYKESVNNLINRL